MKGTLIQPLIIIIIIIILPLIKLCFIFKRLYLLLTINNIFKFSLSTGGRFREGESINIIMAAQFINLREREKEGEKLNLKDHHHNNITIPHGSDRQMQDKI